MQYPVLVKNYRLTEVNLKEILRYAGVKGDAPQINQLICDCLKELDGKISFKICYAQFPVNILGERVDFDFAATCSKDLAKNLKDCKKAVIFAATIGIEIDRLIAKYNALSPAKALIFQAIGAERIESLCDLFEREIKEKFKYTKPRFSAGYGDLKLDFQRDIFSVLRCFKNIGLTLNDSLLMSPSKSVTAIIGLSNNADCQIKSGCAACEKIHCEFRSEKCL